MGSEFLTIDQAAAKLRVTKRSVLNYLRRGLLRRERQGKNKVCIPLEDVEQLQTDLGVGFPPMSRKTFFQLWARVQRLEADMVVVKRGLGVGGSPLRPTKQEAILLSEHARRALDAGQWGEEELVSWADLFDRADEVFFETLDAALEASDGWLPFYQLCVAQMKQVSFDPRFKTSLSLQALHSHLTQGLQHIRQAALVYIEAGGGKTTETAVAKMDGVKATLEKRLTAKG
jgi:excisionase family DNA binding protein